MAGPSRLVLSIGNLLSRESATVKFSALARSVSEDHRKVRKIQSAREIRTPTEAIALRSRL